MKSFTIKLAEYKGHIQGYCLMYPPTNNTIKIMDKITEFLQKKTKFKYINHDIYTQFIENKELKRHIPDGYYCGEPIPKGTLSYYIKLYAEER